MSKTSSAVKDRWNKKTYDQVAFRVPKGRKETLEQRAQETGESVNGYLNRLIRDDLGLSEAQWKTREADSNKDPAHLA